VKVQRKDTVTVPLYEDFVPIELRTVLNSEGEAAGWQIPLDLRNSRSQDIFVEVSRSIPRSNSSGNYRVLRQQVRQSSTFIDFGKDDHDATLGVAQAFAHAISICNAFRAKTPGAFR
jgi:hypothetical protein